jgi:hypothetical protein
MHQTTGRRMMPTKKKKVVANAMLAEREKKTNKNW